MSAVRKIIFFVPPKVHILDLTGPIQVFYEANAYGASYKLHYISLEANLVSAAGLPFGQISHFTQIIPTEGDYIVVPGAEMDYLRSAKFKKETGFFNWLMSLPGRGVSVCSICTGAFILGQAGLLDGVRCTTHWKRLDELQQTYPAILAEPNILYTHTDHLYTSAGITSGIDLSLAIIEEHYGPLFTHKVARELVVYHRRSQNHSQKSVYLDFRNHLHPGVHQVQDWLIENLHQKVTVEGLARLANMSSRNLTRAFKNATGITINDFMKQLRLEKADSLGNNPSYSAEYIAEQLGYSNARQLRRIKKKKS
jgi:transcriptional regulator GlxA family with amidase domain